MKMIRFLIAGVVAFWTVGIAVGFVRNIVRQGQVRWMMDVFPGIAAFTASLLFSIWLFQWALHPLKNQDANNREDESNRDEDTGQKGQEEEGRSR